MGRAIIDYAIEAALACFEDVIVSTDDDEIAQVAIRSGASVPFRRSAENASDTASTVPVLLEVLDNYLSRSVFKSLQITDVCCIYPCNPFITPAKLEHGLTVHLGSGADSTFPVVQYGYPVQRSLRIKDGRVEMRWPENYEARSQDLEPTYHDAGQFYWLNVEALREQQRLFMKRSTPLIYPEIEVQDIDTLEDWHLAEVKYQLWRKNNSQSLSSAQAIRVPLVP